MIGYVYSFLTGFLLFFWIIHPNETAPVRQLNAPLQKCNFSRMLFEESESIQSLNGPAFEYLGRRSIASLLSGGGNIYAVDPLDNRVYCINQVSGVVTTILGTGEQVFTTAGGRGDTVSLFVPKSVVGDRERQYLFVSDRYHIWKYHISSGMVSCYAGGTQRVSFSAGDGGQATSAYLNDPVGMWLTTEGVLYVAESAAGKIRAISLDGVIKTVAGAGLGFGGDGKLATSSNVLLSFPNACFLDNTGSLFIADSLNGRVRVVNAAGIISTFAGGGTIRDAKVAATSYSFGIVSNVRGDDFGNILISDATNAKLIMVDPSGIVLALRSFASHEISFSGFVFQNSVPNNGLWVDTNRCVLFEISASNEAALSLGPEYVPPPTFAPLSQREVLQAPVTSRGLLPPRVLPVVSPTIQPSFATKNPSLLPSLAPSSVLPTVQPSPVPTTNPPSPVPSRAPTFYPSLSPSEAPTYYPTLLPSEVPTSDPTSFPSVLPTNQPVALPSGLPTNYPSSIPSGVPTQQPFSVPSRVPSGVPSAVPSSLPSKFPTKKPTPVPSVNPTERSAPAPSVIPTAQPVFPSPAPTIGPTSVRSNFPSLFPSEGPTNRSFPISSLAPSIRPVVFPALAPRSPTAVPLITSQCPSTNVPLVLSIPVTTSSPSPLLTGVKNPSILPSIIKSIAPSSISGSPTTQLISNKPISQVPTTSPMGVSSNAPNLLQIGSRIPTQSISSKPTSLSLVPTTSPLIGGSIPIIQPAETGSPTQFSGMLSVEPTADKVDESFFPTGSFSVITPSSTPSTSPTSVVHTNSPVSLPVTESYYPTTVPDENSIESPMPSASIVPTQFAVPISLPLLSLLPVLSSPSSTLGPSVFGTLNPSTELTDKPNLLSDVVPVITGTPSPVVLGDILPVVIGTPPPVILQMSEAPVFTTLDPSGKPQYPSFTPVSLPETPITIPIATSSNLPSWSPSNSPHALMTTPTASPSDQFLPPFFRPGRLPFSEAPIDVSPTTAPTTNMPNAGSLSPVALIPVVPTIRNILPTLGPQLLPVLLPTVLSVTSPPTFSPSSFSPSSLPITTSPTQTVDDPVTQSPSVLFITPPNPSMARVEITGSILLRSVSSFSFNKSANALSGALYNISGNPQKSEILSVTKAMMKTRLRFSNAAVTLQQQSNDFEISFLNSYYFSFLPSNAIFNVTYFAAVKTRLIRESIESGHLQRILRNLAASHNVTAFSNVTCDVVSLASKIISSDDGSIADTSSSKHKGLGVAAVAGITIGSFLVIGTLLFVLLKYLDKSFF
jgi:hypothetical protein